MNWLSWSQRHSGMVRRTRPGISRFRVRSFHSRPGMTIGGNGKTGDPLAPIGPTPKSSCVQRCIFACCKYARGRRYRPALPTSRASAGAACMAFPADGPNTFQTKGRAVDGGLARLDADRGGRRPRDDARTERVSDHGGALDPRLLHAVPADPPERRVRGDEDIAAAAACRAQSHSLCRPARLVLRADADPARPGGIDRIHHADLDRDPGREFSRRAHDGRQDFGHRARCGRRARSSFVPRPAKSIPVN
jgi:hypothetical protein